MGGFNINLPGLNFNLTPEAIDAARRSQGLPPLNGAPPPNPGFQLNQTPFGPNPIQMPAAAPEPAPIPPPVAAPVAPPPVATPPVVDSEGVPADIRPSIGQGVGSFLLNERFGQNLPVEPRVPIEPAPAPAPPPPVATPAPAPAPAPAMTTMSVPAATGGIESIDLSALEGFNPQAPLNPVAAPAPAPAAASTPAPTPAASTVPLTGGPPVGYQGGGGEYNPSDGFTDEDRIAADAFYAEQQRAQREQQFADREASQAPPPITSIESPPVEDDYVEVPIDTGQDSTAPPPLAGDTGPGIPSYDPGAPAQSLDSLLSQLQQGMYAYGDASEAFRRGFLTEEELAQFTNAFNEYTGTVPGQRPYEIGDIVSQPTPPLFGPQPTTTPPGGTAPSLASFLQMLGQGRYVYGDASEAFRQGFLTQEELNQFTQALNDYSGTVPGERPYEIGDVVTPLSQETSGAPAAGDVTGSAPAPVVEPPPPRFSYRPYVPQQFQYILPDFIQGFAPPAFSGGASGATSQTSYTPIEVTGPETGMAGPESGTGPVYQPIPSFQVAQPEYVQIQGPSAPVVDPFATPIQPEFAPLPSYERTGYSPQTQKMVDQILSEEEIANPFMNPYLRSGVFGRG